MRCALCGRTAEVLWSGVAVCDGCTQEIAAGLIDRRFPNDFPEVESIARAVERRVQEKRAEQARQAQGVLL